MTLASGYLLIIITIVSEYHTMLDLSQNVLRAVSQIDAVIYYPYVDDHKSTIQNFIEDFFLNNILPQLKELENYIVDFFVTIDKVLKKLVAHSKAWTHLEKNGGGGGGSITDS